MRLLLAALIATQCFVAAPLLAKESEEGAVPMTTYLLHQQVRAIDILHRLQLGLEADAADSIASWEASTTKDLHRFAQEFDLGEQQEQRIYTHIRIIAIQNEKFPVERWLKDSELMGIFEYAIAQDPEHARQLRCSDWSQPKWAGEYGCSD